MHTIVLGASSQQLSNVAQSSTDVSGEVTEKEEAMQVLEQEEISIR